MAKSANAGGSPKSSAPVMPNYGTPVAAAPSGSSYGGIPANILQMHTANRQAMAQRLQQQQIAAQQAAQQAEQAKQQQAQQIAQLSQAGPGVTPESLMQQVFAIKDPQAQAQAYAQALRNPVFNDMAWMGVSGGTGA